jgi:hypothetical protein
MYKRFSMLLVAALILAFAIAATGCGSDDKSSGSGSADKSSSSDKKAVDDTPDNVNEAVDKCLKEVDKLPDADSKKTAKAACEAAKSGDPSKVKDAAREQCLKLTDQIPAGTQRDQAKETCKTSTK